MKNLAISLLVATSLVLPVAYAADYNDPKANKGQSESMSSEGESTKMMDTEKKGKKHHGKRHHKRHHKHHGKKHHPRHHHHHDGDMGQSCGAGCQ